MPRPQHALAGDRATNSSESAGACLHVFPGDSAHVASYIAIQ